MRNGEEGVRCGGGGGESGGEDGMGLNGLRKREGGGEKTIRRNWG